MKTLDWNNASAEERNAACAENMPPSEINPIRSYYLTLAGKLGQRLAVKSLADAQCWLRIARANPNNWNSIMPELPWVRRGDLGVKEVCHHVRYSNTPGGAWMLAEELVDRGWVVDVQARKSCCTVSARRDALSYHARLKRPMAEVAAIIFLRAQGVKVCDL